MRRSASCISHSFIVGLISVINCLLYSSALAQNSCDNTYSVVSLSDTFNFANEVVVRADIPDNQTKVIGCINVPQSGFYRINSMVSYSNAQDNESFFFQVCDKQTLNCQNACNPNLGPYNIIVDETDVADTTVRDGGTFYLTQGDNILTVTHYATIAYDFPRYINGSDSIDGAQSIHMKGIVLDLIDHVFDVEVMESPSITAVNPGDEYQYRLAVKNVEKSTVYFVNLKNALPPYVSPVSYSLQPESFDGDTLFWTFDSLSSGDSVIVDVNVRVDDSPPIRPFDLVNKTWVTGSCDFNSVNGLDSSVVVILPPVFYDLEVRKTTQTDSLFRGQNVSFEIQVKNSGPDTAANISVVDLLPSNLSFLSADFEPQRTTPDSIYWLIDTLATGDSISFNITTRVNAAGFQAPSQILNRAIVISENDINATNNEAVASVDIVPRRADLAVVKTVDRDSVFKEKSFTYSITLENTGPDTATNIEVIDFLPADLILQAVEPQPVSSSGDTVLWRIDTLAIGDMREFTLSARADTNKISVPVSLTNRVTASAEFDPDTSNNEAIATVKLVPRRYDLSVMKTASHDSVFKEHSVSYNITVENAGPDTASNIIVRDVKGDNIVALSYTPEPLKVTGDSIFWRIDTLAVGESRVFTINARPDTNNLTVPTELTNFVTIESENDADPANNEDTAIVRVVPRRYDLFVEKTASRDSIFKEHSFNFNIIVENAGPDTANNIIVKDVKSANITALSYEPAPVRVSEDSIFWQIDSLAFGERRLFSVSAKADTNQITVPATLSNIAMIESENDVNILNNADSALVRVVPRRYDLSVTKTASRDSIFKEQNYSYRITVTNAGPDTASNIFVKDVKSENIIALSYDPEPARVAGDSIFWRIDSLAAGESQIFTIHAKADTSQITVPAELRNLALIESENDSDPANNEDTAIVRVVPRRYDLFVEKTASRDSIFKEHSFSYLVSVGNNGPDTAVNIGVGDVMPDNIIALVFEPEPGQIAGDTLFWHIDSLAVGENRVFRIHAKADTNKINIPAELPNFAFIESENDIEPANNEDAVTVKVVPRRYDLSVTKTASRDSIFREHSFSFRINVQNAGPDTASNITVTDVKPDNIIAVSYEPEPIRISGDSLFWHIDTLAVGAQRTITISARADTNQITVPATLSNIAMIESENDTDPGNNQNDAVVKVVPRRYDIQIIKTAGADSVFPAQGFAYTLSISNAGPDTASSIQVKDVVPDQASLLAFDPQPQITTVDSIFWSIAILPPNEAVTINIRARADSGKTGLPRPITNAALVSSKRDINSSNDISTVTNYIVRKRSDLQLTKSASVDSVNEGGTFSYSLLVENVGRDVAETILLWDLPSTLTTTGAFSLTPDYSQQDTLFWLFDSLSAGDFFEIRYAAQAPDSVPTTPFEIPSFARIFAENDVNPQNDFSESIVIIRPQDDCIVFDRNVLIPQRGERLAIEFELGTGRNVTIDILDVAGHRVGNLRKEFFPPGLHKIEWDGKNQNGRDVGSGTYLVTFKSGRIVCYKKVIVVH